MFSDCGKVRDFFSSVKFRQKSKNLVPEIVRLAVFVKTRKNPKYGGFFELSSSVMLGSISDPQIRIPGVILRGEQFSIDCGFSHCLGR